MFIALKLPPGNLLPHLTVCDVANCMQDVLHQDSIDAMQSFMLCQGNARELRQVGEGLTMQYSTVQYHDRR